MNTHTHTHTHKALFCPICIPFNISAACTISVTAVATLFDKAASFCLLSGDGC